MKKKILNLLALCLLLCSCSSGKDDDFYGGRKLDSEAISSIEAMLDETTAPKYAAETDASGNTIVFWTEGGSVYHQVPNCSSLSKSKVILSGAIHSAAEAGKTRQCSNCFE